MRRLICLLASALTVLGSPYALADDSRARWLLHDPIGIDWRGGVPSSLSPPRPPRGGGGGPADVSSCQRKELFSGTFPPPHATGVRGGGKGRAATEPRPG